MVCLPCRFVFLRGYGNLTLRRFQLIIVSPFDMNISEAAPAVLAPRNRLQKKHGTKGKNFKLRRISFSILLLLIFPYDILMDRLLSIAASNSPFLWLLS